ERRIIVVDHGAAETAVLTLEIGFIEIEAARQREAKTLDQADALILHVCDEAAEPRQRRLLRPLMRSRRKSVAMLDLAQGKFAREIEPLLEVRRLVFVRIGVEAAGRYIAATGVVLPEQPFLVCTRQMEEPQPPIEERL